MTPPPNPSQPNDGAELERLREQLGISSSQEKLRAGALGPATWEERQQAHAEQMRKLAEAGADYAGKETIRRLFKRAGR